ncbi:hypothetical protein [Stigmatella hybrida]|uniref:hypothetical protein n=1 Tax=Stigmatella hybrida TaxID=394097 RepID=UPI001CDA5637|nr:hypothetical protein [Stigmatella hybrida]
MDVPTYTAAVQTPGHAVLNLALLSGGASSALVLPIVAGAVAPDVPIVVLYLREKYLRGLPDERIWSESYQRPFWLNLIHGAHSIPLTLLGALVFWALGLPALAAFFASALLHALGDLPVHAQDAHRHFLPFSHYRFISPLSYWDVRHHARIVALVEALLVIGAAGVLGAGASAVGRTVLAAVAVWYLVNYWKNFLR